MSHKGETSSRAQRTPKFQVRGQRGGGRRKSAGEKEAEKRRLHEEEDELIYTGTLAAHEHTGTFDFDDSSEVVNKVANRTFFTVFVYDIVDSKRRTKLAKLLLGYGERVQYSGFEGHLTARQLSTISVRIKRLIDEKVDKVRIYKISGEPQVEIFGSAPLVEREEFTII